MVSKPGESALIGRNLHVIGFEFKTDRVATWKDLQANQGNCKGSANNRQSSGRSKPA